MSDRDEKRRVPKLRFPGFTDEWEKRKLGDVCTSFEYGLNAAATSYDGMNKYLRITDIDDRSHRFIYSDLTSPDTDIRGAEHYKLSEGDILFARTGASVGKTYLYRRSDGVVYYAGFLIRAKIKPDYDAEFIFQNTLSNNYDKFIRITSQRSGQPGVNAQEYVGYWFFVPTLDEQKKIGVLLAHLDHLNTLHQLKLEHLQRLKKCLLQKMFPKNGEKVPELRFPEFTDTWEQRKLGKLTSLITKGTTPIDKSGTGTINFIKIECIDSSSGEITITSKISEDEHNGHLRRSQLQENDILFSIAGTLGRVTAVNQAILPANTNQALAIIRLKSECISYITTYLKAKAVADFVRRNPTVGAQPNLSLEQVGSLEIALPSIDEQRQIGSFFRSLDHLITLHQRKLEHVKDLKKGLLQQIFI